LSRAALAYVERYPSTVASLTRVLKRKLERYEHKSGEALPDEARGWVDPIVKELVERGFVDDQRLAAAKTASLQRKGKSKRAVSAALRAKGVQSETIDEVLAASETSDEQAAWQLARKKKLGPYRDPETRKALRQKDLAVLGRAGFSFQTARAIIESDEPRDARER
jgi:regulatory protein